ncbi:protein of unknown function [Cyanobium sp. NIES-981]|nr:protein of unknown function [Cyanobium sp. NIES-981]
MVLAVRLSGRFLSPNRQEQPRD